METKTERTTGGRIGRVREDVMGRKGSWPRNANRFLTDVALWRAVRSGGSRVQQRAGFLRELVRIAPIEIGPDWRLAGEHLAPERFASLRAGSDELHAMTDLGVPVDSVQEVSATVRAWQERRRNADAAGPAAYHAVGECPPEMQTGRGDWG
jgi:hypothetical protein